MTRRSELQRRIADCAALGGQGEKRGAFYGLRLLADSLASPAATFRCRVGEKKDEREVGGVSRRRDEVCEIWGTGARFTGGGGDAEGLPDAAHLATSGGPFHGP